MEIPTPAESKILLNKIMQIELWNQTADGVSVSTLRNRKGKIPGKSAHEGRKKVKI